MSKKTTVVVDTQMTASEKRGLEKVVRERFRLLSRAVEAESWNIRAMIEGKINEQYAERIAYYQERAAEIEEEAMALKLKADKIAREAMKEGFTVGVKGRYGVSKLDSNIFTYDVHTDFASELASKKAEAQSKKLIERVHNTMKKKAGVGVEMKQSQFLETIWLNGVTSKDAHEFLNSIPSLDELIAEAASGTKLIAS